MTEQEEVVRQIGLAFELSDGTFLEERVVISGTDIPSLFGEADVFGRNATFGGRTYLGFTGHIATLDEALEEDDVEDVQSVLMHDESPALTSQQLSGFLSDWDLEEIPRLREYEEIDALDPSFEEIRWWTHRAAFGHATSVAIDLKRCCVRDRSFAGAAAFSALDALHHQGSLYPVTPVILPYLVDLVVHPEITCRRVIATGLAHIAEAVAEVPERGKIAELIERLGTELIALSPLGKAELVNVLRRHVDSARSVRTVWPKQAERLESVVDDPAVGSGVQSALELLRE